MAQKTDRGKKIKARLFVSGRVQGVGYRNFCFQNAEALGLKGWVRNLKDGRVALEVGGGKGQIEALIERLRQGPPRAEVREVSVSWEDAPLQAEGFWIDY